MPIAISVIISLILVTATVLLHYELLQFAAGLPDRLTSPVDCERPGPQGGQTIAESLSGTKPSVCRFAPRLFGRAL